MNSNNKICSNSQFKVKSDKLANWEEQNPVLLAGEPSVVTDATDSKKIKIGDGVTKWKDLPYWKGAQDITIDDLLDGDIEIVFDGGNASENAEIFIVEKEMSDTSDNPVANRVIKGYVDETFNTVKGYVDETFNTAKGYVDETFNTAKGYVDDTFNTAKGYVDDTFNMAKDYVVEYGKKEVIIKGSDNEDCKIIWRYRKWNSGVAECWTAGLRLYSAFTKSWGSLYLSDEPFPIIPYPFSLSADGSAPICNIDFAYSTLYTGYIFAPTQDDMYGNTPKIYAWFPQKTTYKHEITGRIFAIGKWKTSTII